MDSNSSKKILDNLIEYLVEEKDIFEKDSQNIQLFNNFLDFQTNQNLKESKYYIESKKSFETFYLKIKNKNYSKKELEKLNSFVKNNLNNFQYYNFSENEKNDFINLIENNLNYCEETKEKINKCIKYYEDFSSSEDNKNRKILKNLKENVEHDSLEQIEMSFCQFQDIMNGMILRMQKFNEIKHKFIFSQIFIEKLKYKIQKEEIKFNTFIEEIENMKNLLSFSTFDKINVSVLNEMLFLYSNEDSLKNELRNLKEYFNYDSNIEYLEKYLLYKFNKNIFLCVLKGYKIIISLLKLKQTDLYYDLLKIIEIVKDYNNEEINEEKG